MNNDTVSIELDKVRIIRYDRKALKKLEGYWNKKLSEFTFENLGVDDSVMLLHIGLQHEDETLTIEKTEELIDTFCPHLAKITEKCAQAFTVSILGPQDNKKK